MSSGDLLADRRFGFAKAFVEDGDDCAAADLFEQVLERAPHWAPAWLALGLARGRLGDIARAGEALDRAVACDAVDTLGAGLHRARLRGGRVDAMPGAFRSRAL